MKLLRLIVAALLVASPAAAQWQTSNHSVPIGRGAGATGFGAAAPGIAGGVYTSNGPNADPSFQLGVGALLQPGQVLGNPTTGTASATPATNWIGGKVSMYPNPGNNPGSGPANQVALNGFGVPVPILSTTTGGLAELEAKAALIGWPMVVSQFGINSAGNNPQFIGTSTTWQTSPRGIWSVEISDTTINCTMINATPCIQFDSAEIGHFKMGGQVVKNDAGPTITIKPVNPTPNDHFIVFSLNDFSVTTLVGSATAEALLKIDPTATASLGVQQNIFDFKELNGGDKGVKVLTPSAISGGLKPIWNANILTALAVHGQTTSGIEIGQSATRQHQLDGNEYHIAFSSSSMPDGIVSWASRDTWFVGANDQNTLTNCVNLKSGATNNVIILRDVAGCTNPVVDANIPGGGNVVIGNGNITVGGFGIALQNSNNTFANVSTTTGLFFLGSVSGTLELKAPAGALGSNVVTFPIGTTDFSATGGAGKFVKQASAGAALTVVQPAVSDLTGFGTGVATALAVNVGTAGSFVVNGGALGTPSSGTLTSATGLPISTGLTGAGTGVLAALAVNTGTAGSFVVNGGAGGTPSSLALTNATGLPISTGLTGAGTGVLAALTVNIGTAGAPVLLNGAGGSPSSLGTLPAHTLGGTVSGGGNQLNNIIIGAATPLAGSFTTVSLTGSSAPANGLYLPAANTIGIAANSQPALEITNPASAVNFSTMSGAATGVAPYLLATGSDTDVSFFLVTKGAGTMNFSGNSAVTGLNSFARFSAASSAAQNGIWIFGGNAGSGPRLIALDLSGTGNANVDLSVETSGTGLVKFGTASAFTANGTVATTVTSLGPTGSHTTVQEWLTVKNSAGVIRYIQAF